MFKTLQLVTPVLILMFFLPLETTAANLEIYHIEGNAEVRSPEREDWGKIEPEDEISPASELRIDSGSFLEVEIAGAHRVRFNEKTGMKFNLDDASDSLNLYYGSIEIELVPEQMTDFDDDLTVHTPVSIMGVRGTQFKTSYEMEQTNWTGVDRGAVWFEADTRTELAAGTGVDVEPDTPGGKPSLTRLGEIREELHLTWDHWTERQRVKRFEQMLVDLNEEIYEIEEQLNTEPLPRQHRSMKRRLQQLKNRKEQIENRLEPVREALADIQQRYSSYREELEERRQDFIENRQEAFADFIEEREERFEEFRERRQERRRE